MKMKISPTGPALSRIVAGVMNWGIWGADLSTSEIAALVEGCCQMGVSSFDNADIYGGYTTETSFGKGWKESGIAREQIEIITKFGIVYPKSSDQVKAYNTTSGYIRQQVDQSLLNLQTDYIDVLLLHRPSPIMDVAQIGSCIQELKAEGKIKHFGVSNFTLSQMELFENSIELCTNQVEASLLHLDPFTDGTFDACQKMKMHPMIWSPLGNGKLFSDSGTKEEVERIHRIEAVCKKYDWTLAQAAFLFLLHPPFALLPVTGTSKLSRIQEALSLTDYKISNAQWFELWTASTGVKVP